MIIIIIVINHISAADLTAEDTDTSMLDAQIGNVDLPKFTQITPQLCSKTLRTAPMTRLDACFVSEGVLRLFTCHRQTPFPGNWRARRWQRPCIIRGWHSPVLCWTWQLWQNKEGGAGRNKGNRSRRWLAVKRARWRAEEQHRPKLGLDIHLVIKRLFWQFASGGWFDRMTSLRCKAALGMALAVFYSPKSSSDTCGMLYLVLCECDTVVGIYPVFFNVGEGF